MNGNMDNMKVAIKETVKFVVKHRYGHEKMVG